MPNVEWRTPDDGERNCPKHVEFLDKNKFGKISASVGFIKKKQWGLQVTTTLDSLTTFPGSFLVVNAIRQQMSK